MERPLPWGPDADSDDRQPWKIRSMPVRAETLVPWLAGATVVAGVVLVALMQGVEWTVSDLAVPVVGLVGLIAAASMVAIRSRAELEAADRDERARPALDELLGVTGRQAPGPSSRAVPGSPAYVLGMARWTAACLELLEHAAATAAALGRPSATELAGACEDTQALSELLRASSDGPLALNDTASLHAICSLWETNQARLEALAADVDPRWHRRWRARTVVERRLRHGARDASDLVLPYRS